MQLKSTSEDTYYIQDIPNICPFCFRTITPYAIICHLVSERHLEAYFICNNKFCYKSFIGYYEMYAGEFTYMKSSIGNKEKKSFSNTINNISPTFEKIYNEAYFAEQNELFQICGVGYRKAIEFLIKDYAILNNPDKRESIEKDTLSNCISLYVNDQKIKSIITRATWLGNDETHYVRKWENKDLADLKLLIDIAIHWIEMESLTSTFIKDMPG